MKKLFGIEMEFNFTADEDVMKGLGKGISKGAVSLAIGTVAALCFNKCVISFYPKELTFKYDIDFSLGKKYLFLIFVLIAVRVALQFFNEIIDHKFITPAIYGMALIFGAMIL